MNTDHGGTGRAITDRGRFLSEALHTAHAAGGEGRWIAARLSDGKTDGNLYDSKADAVRHQLDETQCAYMPVPPFPMPEHEATLWLELNERIYASGRRLSDPDEIAAARLGQEATPYLNRSARRRQERESARFRHPAGRNLG